jgi:hypothetical protein
VLTLVVLVGAGAGTVVGAQSGATETGVHNETAAGSATATLVVDADGSGDYTTIQAGVDAAAAGDTVEVRPGTYTESVTIDRSITLTAPDGAKLLGSEAGFPMPNGIVIRDDAAPTIRGLNISSYLTGINATETTGDWTVEDSTVVNHFSGVRAERSTGDWTVDGVDLTDNLVTGVNATDADGAWTVSDVEFASSLGGIQAKQTDGAWTVTDASFERTVNGIIASSSSASWSVSDTTIDGTTFGLNAANASADWQARNLTVERSVIGLFGTQSEGDWTVTESTFDDVDRSNRIDSIQNSPVNYTINFTTYGGTAIAVNETSGSWSVSNTAFTDFSVGINATDASPRGDATSNWWGQASGPAPGDCVGNVDCAGSLSSPPDGTPSTPSLTLPGQSNPAGNLDDDSLLEDVNGDGDGNVFDVLTYYNNRDSDVVQNNPEQFDFDEDGEAGTLFDALALYNEISG